MSEERLSSIETAVQGIAIDLKQISARLDARLDVLSAEIGDLRTETHTLNEDLRAESRTLNEGLRAEMRGLNEGLRTEMRGLNEGLRTEMRGLNEGLRTEMRELNDGLRTEMYALNKDLRTEMHALNRELRTEVHTLHDEARQHASVLHEAVLAAIAGADPVPMLRREIQAGDDAVRADVNPRLENLEAAVRSHSARLDAREQSGDV